MSHNYDDVLSSEEIEYILNLPEVLSAKEKIVSKSNGSIYFYISLTSAIKNTISEKLGLNLTNIESIPMRWIKGDTLPHVDRGVSSFEKTYLMYLTDSTGELVVENNSYPISKGSAYVFPEGLHHETINTGNEPRLLLGPMSEKAFAVGGIATKKYIRQDPVGTDIQYSYNNTDFFTISSWPHVLDNYYVEFVTDITLTDVSQFFICDMDNIQIGSTTLKSDGTRPIITINGVTNYPGLIKNGDTSNAGKNNIRVFNLDVRAINGSTLYSSGVTNPGWIGQSRFGKLATDNYIINCSSNGPIPQLCGGIVGSFSGSTLGSGTAELTIIGCSSSGTIGQWAGGIAGGYGGAYSGGNITFRSCWSTGEISSQGAGGIVGTTSGIGLGRVTIFSCYSEGNITGVGAGGIIGEDAGETSGGAGTIEITQCYSRGNMSNTDTGGIIGRRSKGTNSIINCYSTGNITSARAGGIAGPPTNAITVISCYASGSTSNSDGYIIGQSAVVGTNYSEAANSSSGWNSTNANTVLEGTPNIESPVIGQAWVLTDVNQPYELVNMGHSPYTRENIYYMGTEPTLNNLFPPVGNDPTKDMDNDIYTNDINPSAYQGLLFGGLADFIDGNIVAGDKNELDRLTASYWNDLGNDVFDGWGYFYLYDVPSGKYYFPILNPQNQDDGIITTQTFSAFGRTFTIKHGWSIRGVFKIDISVADSLPFRFGAYGDMGSDSAQELKQNTYDYTLGGQSKTLYYHCDREENNDREILYSYFIPKTESENYPNPYDVYYSNGIMGMKTTELTTGVTIYFSKSRDVREFVVNELKVAAGESSIDYNIPASQSGESALINGRSYSILQKTKAALVEVEGGFEIQYQLVESDTTISINSSTGAISTTSSTPLGIYQIYVRNNGSYHVSIYVLIVKEASGPGPEPEPEVVPEYYFNNRNKVARFTSYQYNGLVAWKRYRSWWRRWSEIEK